MSPAPVRVVAPPSPRPTSAMHATSIVHLAVSPDGLAAVSSDQHGAIRLWPRLDGTREPVVVHAAIPQALAIARDGEGFAIAVQDGALGVELVRVTGDGQVRGQTMLATEPPIVQLELTAWGVLVLRADQSLELHDVTGTSRARLLGDAGTRIRSLVSRAGRVLALIDHDDELRGRWIELAANRLSWGEPTPPLPLDRGEPISLSPDHLKVVGIGTSAKRRPVLVDLATGKPAPKAICATDEVIDAQPPNALGFDNELGPTPLGFYDARTVACSVSGQLVWWSTTGGQITPGRADMVTTAGTELAIGDRLVAGGVGHQLGLYTPAGPHYLGYGFRDLTHLRVAPAGVMIGRGDQQPLLLDESLHERSRYALPKQDADWTDILPIDDRFLLTVATRPMSADAWGNTYQVALYDAVKHTVHQLLPNRAQGWDLAFEPATKLLVSSDGAQNLLLRYDATTHSFAERIEVVTQAVISHIYLVDPARADGMIALAVHSDDGGLIVDELYAADQRGSSIKARASHRISGELRAVDRAGHLYVHGVMDKQDVGVYRHGTTVAMLHGAADFVLRPSPDGSRVAGYGGQRVYLATSAGVPLWEAATWGATEVVWSPGGELIARYPGSLAKLDLATGALVERQCGWAFGLQDYAFESTTNAPAVCDVAP